jgi:hypothetical protein
MQVCGLQDMGDGRGEEGGTPTSTIKNKLSTITVHFVCCRSTRVILEWVEVWVVGLQGVDLLRHYLPPQ